MLDWVVIGVAVGGFVVAAAARRRRTAGRVAAARTIELVATADGVRRVLADGREESVRWTTLASVELVCTPVPTADGARAFLLLGASENEGCLVPLGVGLEAGVLTELSRLPGFRIERLAEARRRRPPARAVVWERPAVDT